MRVGEATAMGAVSIVNAIASGRGATVSVDLPTTARVTISEEKGRWNVFENGKKARSRLALDAVEYTMRSLGRNPTNYSGSVETVSSAPTGVGLKTSSSASVAIALGVCFAFGEKSPLPSMVLDCSVRSSLSSGVSVTGAMDDAASCLLGGVNFVDNRSGKIVSSAKVGRPLKVVIRIPYEKSRRSAVPVRQVRKFSRVADSIFSIGLDDPWRAMTLNGLMHSSIYGYDPSPALQAVESGALGAGLSGTGPAVAAVFEERGGSEDLTRAWEGDGARVISTKVSDGGATIGS